MNALVKNLLAGLAVGSLALAGAVTADDDNDHLKHKVIEIKADSNSDVSIVLAGDETETISLTFDELNDDVLLEQKLAHLDDEMRADDNVCTQWG